MKLHTLPTKRQPVQKGILKRLSAVTANRRRQRVSAAAVAETDYEDSSSKISRALTIIFFFHILAIGLWFVHERFLEGESGGETAAASVGERVAEVPVTVRPEGPRLSSGENAYFVQAGDNYARIAASQEVDEAELRAANNNAPIQAGRILRVPPKRIVAAESPEIAAIRASAVPERDRGLVEAIPADEPPPPRAIVVKPSVAREVAATPAAGNAYEVKPGDSVWAIANRFKVDQDALMKANKISDPRKLRAGMKLVIPR